MKLSARLHPAFVCMRYKTGVLGISLSRLTDGGYVVIRKHVGLTKDSSSFGPRFFFAEIRKRDIDKRRTAPRRRRMARASAMGYVNVTAHFGEAELLPTSDHGIGKGLEQDRHKGPVDNCAVILGIPDAMNEESERSIAPSGQPGDMV
ncbi:hypothetical protein ColKHC_13960 [Colletotrichum higginsianum]|nr:hypothetical protein ColKHC_13960 [Colletotrichum higginsianum]